MAEVRRIPSKEEVPVTVHSYAWVKDVLGASRIEIVPAASTLDELLQRLQTTFDGSTGTGTASYNKRKLSSCMIAVGDEMTTDLSYTFSTPTTISIFPPVSGG
jgi:molybdopterin converting factor small subunit